MIQDHLNQDFLLLETKSIINYTSSHYTLFILLAVLLIALYHNYLFCDYHPN